MCFSAFGPSAFPSTSLIILFIHSAFSCFWLPYFCPKSFAFPCIQLLECFRVISSHLFAEFSFIVFTYPSFVCIVLHFVDISLVFFLWFISWSCTAIFSCAVISLSSPHVPAFFLCLIILASFWIFFYLRFQLNFPSWFWIFLRAFWGDPKFLQANFPPA